MTSESRTRDALTLFEFDDTVPLAETGMMSMPTMTEPTPAQMGEWVTAAARTCGSCSVRPATTAVRWSGRGSARTTCCRATATAPIACTTSSRVRPTSGTAW